MHQIAITLSTGQLLMFAISALLFVIVTVMCHWQGLFEGNDTLGIGSLFITLFYVVGWLVPSLAMWGIWATWFK